MMRTRISARGLGVLVVAACVAAALGGCGGAKSTDSPTQVALKFVRASTCEKAISYVSGHPEDSEIATCDGGHMGEYDYFGHQCTLGGTAPGATATKTQIYLTCELDGSTETGSPDVAPYVNLVKESGVWKVSDANF